MARISMPDFSPARGMHLLVALSGGADSVALLCMLCDERERLDLTLSATHIDHCIRGEASRSDAEFCKALCASLNVPFHMTVIDVPRCAEESGEGLETAARRLRYEALRAILRKAGADRIALAHHLNDQAETVLMHLLRGCGPDGAGGMETLSGDLYRPLLNTPKHVLTGYLAGRGIPWREDATNSDCFTPRNALRLHGIPALEESYPQAAEAIARYAEAARCENRYMDRTARSFLRTQMDSGPYGRRIRRPDTADEAVLRRALRIVCGPELSGDMLRALVALCMQTRGKMDVSKDLAAERTPHAVYFLPKTSLRPMPTALAVPGRTSVPGLGEMLAAYGAAEPVRDNPFRQALRCDAFEGAILRTRREGDRIRPLGCGDKLLSDYLTDRKIDRPLRDYVPLVAIGNRILWAVGVGISEDVRLDAGADKALVLEWKSEPSTGFETIQTDKTHLEEI